MIIEALRASYLLTSNGKDEIIQCRDKMHLKGACFLSRQWGDPQYIEDLRSRGESITYFEFLTTIAKYHFSKEKVDYAILEAGLGGTRDATNFVSPEVSVITPISKDHTHILGDTIEDITREKCGIIKQGIPVVTSAKGLALEIIKKYAIEKNCDLVIAKDYEVIYLDKYKQVFNLDGLKGLEVHLLGDHQLINAATAIATAQVLKIPELFIREGLKSAFWPGRFEIVSRSPITILDGAHNPVGMAYFVQTYKKLFGKPPIIVLGIKRNKEVDNIINKVAPLADHIIVTDSQFKAMPAEELKKEVDKYNHNVEIVHDAKEAVGRAQSISTSEDIICITGSLYLVGDVRGMFRA